MIELVRVDDAVLDELVVAAVTDAEPDEVTPPLTPSPGWTAERIRWLRTFHIDRRSGLDGALHEATWAVVADGAAVGSVRLARREESAEVGIWLARSARGRGLARSAVAAVLRLAEDARLPKVVARTTATNDAALATLRALDFRIGVPAPDGSVTAHFELSSPAGPATSG